MIPFGNIPAGSVLPIPFDSFAGSTGASITISGLAVTDIEVYKGTSVTQRASDAGYALMDTDGIDLDGITGIQGFSIDTGDNTDAGFYTVGSFFWVVVSAITVDSQTVNFIAATFRIVAAETAAGTPQARASAVADGAISAATLAADTITAAKLAADVTTELQSGLATAANLATVAGYLDTEIAALITELAKVPKSDSTVSFNATALAAVADAFLDRNMATGTDSGSTTVRTARQALRAIRNKWSIAGGTMTVTKEDDTTASWTSSLTGTAGADPITTSDPAGP